MNIEIRKLAKTYLANNCIVVKAFISEKLPSEKKSAKDSSSWLNIQWKKKDIEELFTSKISFVYNNSSGQKRRYYHDK